MPRHRVLFHFISARYAARMAVRQSIVPIPIVAGVLVTLLIAFVLTTMTGPDTTPLTIEAILALIDGLPWPALWFAAAYGYGGLVASRLQEFTPSTPANAKFDHLAAMAIGVAILLALSHLLARLGAFQLFGTLLAWLILLVGIVLAAFWLRRASVSDPAPIPDPTLLNPHPPLFSPRHALLLAAPALTVLVVASLSAPGLLWSTEFSGYDVLSYHLQLPAEWLDRGRMMPLEHNVYSFFPGFMEAAYYHLAVLRGDAVTAAVSAQLLHAGMALLAAIMTGRAAHASLTGTTLGEAHWQADPTALMIAGVLVIGTPWVLVTGSLAYNEMSVVLMMATGLFLLARPAREMAAWKIGAIIGLIAAVAVGAKLTAIGFVAAPLGVLLLWQLPRAAWFKAVLAGSIVGLIVLCPWLIDNAQQSGNPVFPFATDSLGLAHWSEEQARTWNEAHQITAPIGERMMHAWNEFGRFGIGGPPIENEPWKPQWLILPWLALAGGILFAIKNGSRRTAQLTIIVLIQLIFWIGFTHIKSRFMLPAVVPLSILTTLGVVALIGAARPAIRTTLRFVIAALLLLWCLPSVLILAKESGGAPAAYLGMTDVLTGEALSDAQRRELGRSAVPSIYLNHLLPDDAHVLLIGQAAPFYLRGSFTYTTVWDRGPLEELARTSPNEPDRWFRALREMGYTHVYVDRTMLRVWHRSGWLAESLEPDHLLEVLETHLNLIQNWPAGSRLYRINQRDAALMEKDRLIRESIPAGEADPVTVQSRVPTLKSLHRDHPDQRHPASHAIRSALARHRRSDPATDAIHPPHVQTARGLTQVRFR
ncbi:MAG: hypothetical protein EA377_05465 [Phycisphaerales bacterium]|nr:MAG: hypothetical protein EA377_05465 [Phycisphaerales bacterium]